MIMAALLKAKGEDPKLTLHATHIFDLISQHGIVTHFVLLVPYFTLFT